jgi:serine phosphatase RsbU (regulator of sigma subunit)
MKQRRTYRSLVLLVFLLGLSAGNLRAQTLLIDSIRAAVEIAPDDTNKIKDFKYLGAKLITTEPEAAIRYVHRGLALSKTLGDTLFEGKQCLELANLYSNISNYDSSFYYYDQSIAQFFAIGNSHQLSKTYSNLGSTYRKISQFSNAREAYLASLELDREGEDSTAIAVMLGKVGLVLFEMNKYDESTKYYLESMALLEARNDTPGLLISMANYGQLQGGLGNYREAIRWMKKSLAMLPPKPNKRSKGALLNNIGSMHEAFGNLDSALYYYEIAHELFLQGKTTVYYGATGANIASILIKVGRVSEAKVYVDQSVAARVQVGDKSGLSGSYIVLSDYYFKIGEYDNAIRYAKMALKLGVEIESLSRQSKAQDRLYKTYKQKGQFQLSFEAFISKTALKDSIFSSEKAETIAELESKYESDKKQRAIELLQKGRELQEAKAVKSEAILVQKRAESSERSSELKMMLVIVIVLLVLTFLIIFGIRQINRDSKRLKAQKLEIQERNAALRVANSEVEKQNDEIEERNVALQEVYDAVEVQKIELEIRNKEITDSIRYAKRLQTAVLPTRSMMQRLLPDSFVLYEPKDIVSGDFYWMEEKEGKIFLAAVDCTGHGVPGALVSMVGHNGLHRTVHEFGLEQPAAILDKLNELVAEALYQDSDTGINDGMDLSLIVLSPAETPLEGHPKAEALLQYAGANSSLYIIRKTPESETDDPGILQIKADKQPIGPSNVNVPFTNHKINIFCGDRFYLFSDGYFDQFGGPRGKKFKSGNFRDLLISTIHQSIGDQGGTLSSTIADWMGDIEQIDDITVIGVELKFSPFVS